MKFHTSYDVTPEIQDDSVKQYYWHMLLSPRRIFGMVVVVALLLGTIATPYDSPQKTWAIGFLSAWIFFMVIIWAKEYFQFLAQAHAGLKLMGNPKVEVSMEDALVEFTWSTGTRRYQWNNIDRIEDTKDFVILMHGKLPLLSLPKAYFSTDELAFMRHSRPSCR